jgi:hypothetical protein
MLLMLEGSSGITTLVLPSFNPYIYLKNGADIPPPMISSSAKSSIFMISFILSVTFEPPIITKTGLFGAYKKLPRILSYFSIKNPAAFT